MSKKTSTCKTCGQEIAKNAKFCPNCGKKNPQPLYKKWWFWLIIVVLIVTIGNSNNDTDANSNNTTDNNTSESTNSTTNANSGNSSAGTSTGNKKEYRVGDIVQDGKTKIVFMSSGDYTEENSFMQPEEGKKYIFLQFAFENTSKTNDTSISFYNFECYADGYAAKMYYGGDNNLSATLSAGRATTGYLYFEIPCNAEVIEVEYETNLLTEKKIKFIFEGQKDSGYTPQLNTTPTEGAYKVGNVAESSKLKITYLSCTEYISDNMFVVPADGFHFITCEFEFENVGKTDEYISSYNFDCYADNLNCSGVYIREDDLSATLSAGRKTKGTVTFEVPINATTVEVEFLSNYWTSNRVVFVAN